MSACLPARPVTAWMTGSPLLRKPHWLLVQLLPVEGFLASHQTGVQWETLGRNRTRREAAPGRRHQASGHERAYRHQPAVHGRADGMEAREVQRLSGPPDGRRLPLLEDEDLTGEAVIGAEPG